MDTVFANYTVTDIIIAAVVIFVLLSLWSVIKKFLKKDKSSSYAQQVECNCGWKGQEASFSAKSNLVKK